MGEKILVVDDEEVIREMLRTLLETEGYEPILASNGEEALRLAESENPHLIILDAVMPERDGIDTSVALRANEKTRAIPIILATGFAELLTEAVNAGIDDCVVKPFKLDRLMVRVRGMLKVRHLEDELERATAYMQELKKAASPSGKPPTL